MKEKEKGFFAYGSNPSSSGECIEEAIEIINNSGEVDLGSWKKLKISGKIIISKVVEAIDSCDFFCADLTGLNDNVLFELGYAIAKRKSIFLINDISQIDSYRRFKALRLLDTTGYCSYTNTNDIVKHFFNEHPYDPQGILLWDSLIKTIDTSDARTPLLILNGPINTNANLEIVNQAKHFKLPCIIDDPTENKVQPLTWYVQQLHNVPALLAQFASLDRVGFEVHNAKCALISGMALGFGLKVKMIAEKPYDSPLDFRELLEKFSNRKDVEVIVSEFFRTVQKDIGELLVKKEHINELKKKRSDLQKINFGEAIAEHEIANISTYFVETANSNALIKKECNIVIGRKGTGKTATLYYLDRELRDDTRNHVVLITPITFEVEGLVSLMEAINGDFESGYLIECIWKFLIYSEIGKYLYEQIDAKALYAVTDEENKFKEYIERNPNIFLSDFSTRLEEQIKVLKENNIGEIGAGNNREYKLKVSEFLHQGTLGEAREYFAKIIPRKHTLIVLIDNLDKSWKPNSKINILSKYILGLLGATGRIVKELSVVKSIQTNLSFHLTLFLRSDIYRYVMLNAREPDKIEITKLKWDDKELLLRIIEERFVELSNQEYEQNDLWEKFIVDKVDGQDVKNYITNIIFPRPRDIIYLFKQAKDIAVSRGHKKIEEDDIKYAYKEYSSWVFTSLIAENGITIKQMENFMYELMASKIIIDKEFISESMTRASIDTSSEDKIESFIDTLVDLTIIGREIKQGEFEFEYDFDISKKLKVLSKKLNTNRFRIHNALIPYLECGL
jgi:hypothetical protein